MYVYSILAFYLLKNESKPADHVYLIIKDQEWDHIPCSCGP